MAKKNRWTEPEVPEEVEEEVIVEETAVAEPEPTPEPEPEPQPDEPDRKGLPEHYGKFLGFSRGKARYEVLDKK